MKYGLNDNAVKRIAAVAHHRSGSMMDNISDIYNSISHPDTIQHIANAHTLDAMQHKFANKDEENKFKLHLAKAAAVNRGTLEISEPKSPSGEGSEPKIGE